MAETRYLLSREVDRDMYVIEQVTDDPNGYTRRFFVRLTGELVREVINRTGIRWAKDFNQAQLEAIWLWALNGAKPEEIGRDGRLIVGVEPEPEEYVEYVA